jgi:hypothetical protein
MPIDRYRIDDPFENHPLFKSEEQAPRGDLTGTEPMADEEEMVLAWPTADETDPNLGAEAQPSSEDSLWGAPAVFDWATECGTSLWFRRGRSDPARPRFGTVTSSATGSRAVSIRWSYPSWSSWTCRCPAASPRAGSPCPGSWPATGSRSWGPPPRSSARGRSSRTSCVSSCRSSPGRPGPPRSARDSPRRRACRRTSRP